MKGGAIVSYDKQKKRITIKVVPHSDGDMITFQIPRIIPKLLISLILICLIGSSFGFFFYYQQSNEALSTIAHLESVKKQNKRLKSRLHTLSQEAKILNTKFKEIQKTNKEIKQLINFDTSKQKISKKEGKNTYSDAQQVSLNNRYELSSSSDNNHIINLVNNTANNFSKLETLFPKEKLELKELKSSVIEYNDYLASKPTGWPLKTEEKRITSYFGYRTHPVTGERTIHEGLDIGVWYGTKVYATGAGKVIYAGWKGGYGRAVVIDHGYGFRTIYAHNQRLNVEIGERVERGDVVAYTGNSGRSTGPHLHYEILVNGKPVDPLPYLK